MSFWTHGQFPGLSERKLAEKLQHPACSLPSVPTTTPGHTQASLTSWLGKPSAVPQLYTPVAVCVPAPGATGSEDEAEPGREFCRHAGLPGPPGTVHRNRSLCRQSRPGARTRPHACSRSLLLSLDRPPCFPGVAPSRFPSRAPSSLFPLSSSDPPRLHVVRGFLALCVLTWLLS